MGLLPPEGRDLIVTGAILSILLNPVAFFVAERLVPPAPAADAKDALREEAPPTTTLSDHVILVGFGRVGTIVGEGLKERGIPLLVIEDDDHRVERLAALGIEHIVGNAVRPRNPLGGECRGGARALHRHPERLRSRRDPRSTPSSSTRRSR